MKKLYMESDTGERYLITVSSDANQANAAGYITAETGGNCVGPEDEPEQEIEYLQSHWNELEEVDDDEAAERINHLAEEWGLKATDLEYLI